MSDSVRSVFRPEPAGSGIRRLLARGVSLAAAVLLLSPAAFAAPAEEAILPPLRALASEAGEAGLEYRYFEVAVPSTLDLADLDPDRVGTVTEFGIPDGVRRDHFGLEIHGAVEIPADGEYTFYTASDDGSRLYLGGALVVNNDFDHGTEEKSGTVRLAAGRYPICVTYYEGVVSEVLEVSWSGPGIDKQPIPAAALTRAPCVVEIPRDAISVSWLFGETDADGSADAVFTFTPPVPVASVRLQTGVGEDAGGRVTDGTLIATGPDGFARESAFADGSAELDAGGKTVASLRVRPAKPVSGGMVIRGLAVAGPKGPADIRPERLASNALLRITVDTREAPERKAFHDILPELLRRKYAGMLEILGEPGYTPPQTVHFGFRPGINVPAYAAGGHIVLSKEWFAGRPGDLGCLIHELAHRVQSYPAYEPSWLVEGIADYVRYKAAIPDGWRIPEGYRDGHAYTSGYGVTTAFLVYAEKTAGPDFVPALSRALRARTYNEDLFKKLAGADPATLWEQYKKDTAR